ncbi:hypothetical protein L1987_25082 [Smallanthus sonchifolius]|uniref:Uncharacterized protein n=1 Tax=Smallanthus sonchifolius TaxID=185202 RepID=A0ACB9IN63_9ASTR|nr:hypothetical protein L1987_25082 [Smallanthus sonchifolius]
MKSCQPICYPSSSHLPIHHFSLVIFLITAAIFASYGGNETDHLALLSFNSMITNDPYRALTSWNSSFHFYDWNGVLCGKKHKRVTRLLLLYKKHLLDNKLSKAKHFSLSRLIYNMMHVLESLLLCILFMSGGILTLGLKEDANRSLCIEEERKALLDVKANLIDLHGNLSDWASEGEKMDCCKWAGVTCNNQTGHVIQLDLTFGSSGFAGKLSPSLQVLNQLQYLNLSGINFQSNTLPNNLGSLSNLQVLDISSANLSGSIPYQLANLSNLLRLDLSRNFLRGSIPFSFGDLTSLTYLDMSQNQLGGNIPKSLGNCSSLAQLDLSQNLLNGSMPDIMGQLSNLRFLNLSSNSLEGMLPNMTFSFLGYVAMDLSNNHFEGRVPLLPSRLAALNLSGNRFSGTLSFLCEIDGFVSFLDLSNNLFLGNLPDCWANRRVLKVLNLSNNNLSGEIPSSLGKMLAVEALYLRANAFVGEFPMSMSNCIRLRFLDLGENKLSGVIPEWIGEELSGLYVLALGSNQFYGRLPSQVCWLSNLQVLDLSNNELSGSIPRCFDNFTAMTRGSFGDDMTKHYYLSYIPIVPDPSNIPSSFESLNSEEAHFLDNALVTWKGKERCGFPPPPPKKDVEEDEDDFWKSYYIGMGAGFAVGFLGICGALILNRHWRYFFFAWLRDMKDWIYVTMAVHISKLERKF